ncbi:hypothetical protein [Streptomyces vilmorinianum]|uniref:hypothetical protein n=1 Tax=Streptomyces vilmorinianum TaxID=3051092 RepID=UPI0020C82F01|nr:hypothetical protein [Streptomyces vilmorinianum]
MEAPDLVFRLSLSIIPRAAATRAGGWTPGGCSRHDAAPVPAAAPVGPVKTWETASAGYRRALGAHRVAAASRQAAPALAAAAVRRERGRRELELMVRRPWRKTGVARTLHAGKGVLPLVRVELGLRRRDALDEGEHLAADGGQDVGVPPREGVVCR